MIIMLDQMRANEDGVDCASVSITIVLRQSFVFPSLEKSPKMNRLQ